MYLYVTTWLAVAFSFGDAVLFTVKPYLWTTFITQVKLNVLRNFTPILACVLIYFGIRKVLRSHKVKQKKLGHKVMYVEKALFKMKLMVLLLLVCTGFGIYNSATTWSGISPDDYWLPVRKAFEPCTLQWQDAVINFVLTTVLVWHTWKPFGAAKHAIGGTKYGSVEQHPHESTSDVTSRYEQ
eukprot:904985_1